MEKMYFLIALLIVAMLPITGESLSTNKVGDLNEGENLLNEYLNMLADGNTTGVLGLLTGPMLKNNENLLRNNPGYADFLRERYRNSSFVITNYKVINTSKSALDVVIILNTQDEIRTRFTLAVEGDRLKIYAEEEIITK